MTNAPQRIDADLTTGRVRENVRPLRFWAASAIATAALCAAAPAVAQPSEPQGVTSPIPVSPGIPRQGQEAAPAPGPEELGITLGSFRLYPTLDLRAGYDTNVFAQPAGQQTSSGYFAIRPNLDLRSDWNNHMLNAHANGVFGFYTNASSQNYQNFDVGTDGRLDIQRDWYLSGNAGFLRTTEALGSPDVVIASSPTVQNSIPLNLAMYQRFNRLFYQVSGGLTVFSYQDFGTLTSAQLPSSSRNRTEYGENLRAGYEIFEGFDLWMQGGANQRVYLEAFNSAAQNRNSVGWSVTGGSTIDLGGISKLEGYIGFSQQNYDNAPTGQFTTGNVNTGAVVFGLGGVWNGYEPLIVRPFIVRAINETAYTNYIDYVSTTIGAEFTYTIQTEWRLNGGASFGLANYTPVNGVTGAFAHTDNFYRVSLGLLYQLRPQLDIGPLYEFSAGYGPDPNTSPNYTRHIIMLRLVARR
jgi:hypothetical protein